MSKSININVSSTENLYINDKKYSDVLEERDTLRSLLKAYEGQDTEMLKVKNENQRQMIEHLRTQRDSLLRSYKDAVDTLTALLNRIDP